MARNADSGTPGNGGARSASTRDITRGFYEELSANTPMSQDARGRQIAAIRNEMATWDPNKAATVTLPNGTVVEGYDSVGDYFHQKEYGPRYSIEEELELPEAGYTDATAENTQNPTSTTDTSKPRTLLAWWVPLPETPELGTLTVVFRDGTPWSYYQVPKETWVGFRTSVSKGKDWINAKNSRQSHDGILMQFTNGPAAWTDIPEQKRNEIAARARADQYRMARQPTRKRQATVTQRAALEMRTGKGTRLSTDVAAYDDQPARQSLSKFRNSPGANPSAKAGKNPNKNAGKHRNK